ILNYFGEKKDNCNKCDNCIEQNKNIIFNFTSQSIKIFRLLECKPMNTSSVIKIASRGSNYDLEWWKFFVCLLVTYEYLLEYPNQKYGYFLDTSRKAGDFLANPGDKKIILNMPKLMYQKHITSNNIRKKINTDYIHEIKRK